MQAENPHIIGRASELKEFSGGSHLPIFLEFGGFMLCDSGSSDVIVGSKHYTISERDIIVAFPYTSVQLLHASDDFDGIVIGVNFDFFANIQLSNKGNYFTSIKDNAAISISIQEFDRILSLVNMLIEESIDNQSPIALEICDSIIRVLVYKLAVIYSNRTVLDSEIKSRDNQIFNDFIIQIFEECKFHRNLDYYAQSQMITSSHLSRAVKRASGRTAKVWLVDCLLLNIKAQLQDSQKPISLIADELNFPNPSFFSQFFKKYSGQSPLAYRIAFQAARNSSAL